MHQTEGMSDVCRVFDRIGPVPKEEDEKRPRYVFYCTLLKSQLFLRELSCLEVYPGIIRQQAEYKTFFILELVFI